MFRFVPDIKKSPIPSDYSILIHYFDWWAESLDMKMPSYVWDRMKTAKEKAIELDDRRKTPIEFEFGGIIFQMLPNGAAGGREFVLLNPNLRFEFASRERDFSVTWRATSAGLWEYGLEKLIEQVFSILDRECFRPNSEHWRKLSRVDYAFDIEAPSFTKEMISTITDLIVCPKEAKARGDFFIRSGRVETLTIGSKKGLQVQIYDKGLEINEMSGKTWMIDIWMNNGYAPEINDKGKEVCKNVWRLEVRMAGIWLKNRNMKDPNDFLKNMWVLITEGLYSRRITRRNNTDSNRRRWPLHPLYALADKICGLQKEFIPVGYRVTEKCKKLEQMLLANISGTLRSLATLRQRGALDDEKIFDMDEVDKAIKGALEMLENDKDHDKKIIKAKERYKFVDDAK